MSALNRVSVSSATVDLPTKKALFDLIQVESVAAAGSLQSDGTQLSAATNVVTAADNAKAVVLPAAVVDAKVRVINSVADANLIVFPMLDVPATQINALGSNNSFTISGGGDVTFVCTTRGQWYAPSSTVPSAAELALLDTAVAGTVVNSKAVVYDANGLVARSTATPAAAGAASQSNSTLIAAEVNYVTGANGSAGVRLPVPVANKSYEIINSVTTAGNYLNVYPSSGTQINGLGNDAAFQLNPGQRALFVGRSTILHNAAAASDTISGLTASAAELNFNDTSLAGTAVPSKTLVLGADKNVDVLAVLDLKLGAGAGTSVTSDAAELNLLDGSVVANSVASKAALVDSNKRLQTNAANGTPEATVSAVHYGDGVNVTAVLTLTNTPITVGSSANLGVGVLLYTLPTGACMIRDSYWNLVLSGITTGTDTPDSGLGTVIASGVVTTLDGTATFENISTGVAMTNPNSTPTVVAAGPTAGNPLAIATAAAHTVHFNMAAAWSANADADGLLNGTVVLSYIRQAA